MKTFLVVFVAAASAWGQQAAGDRVGVPLSDPSRLATIKAGLINGDITVKAYSGKEVIVETSGASQRSRQTPPPQGMRRIVPTGSGLEVTEENNVVNVSVGPPMLGVDITIQAPANSSVKLETVSGTIRVEGIQGDIEADTTNGSVTLTDVSGAAVAHALNGRVQANFVRAPAKPMSFSSLNGAIDVTLPADVKANVKMRSDNGEILSDFDIVTRPGPGPTVQDNRGSGGKYRVRVDRTVYGTINGGGPEIQFSNFNGPIYIRKAK
jgi:hypothetical protein